MSEDEKGVPEHIRWRCPVAKQLRVEEMDLPPEGHDPDVHVPTGEKGRDDRGRYQPGGETA